MKVLDLDMDFFLSGPCPCAPLGCRPPEGTATVWSEKDVRAFLEEHCGLSKEHRVRGAVFETHDQALEYWMYRHIEHALDFPFDCVHVDTHSDLAFGPPGPDFVLKAVLTRQPNVRPALAAYRSGKKLDEANYLLFAIAFRWIKSLYYVKNPRSMEDVPPRILNEAGHVFLRSDVSALMERMNGIEPVVFFKETRDWTTFQETDFSFATLAQSPRYAPASADWIMDVFREYIDQI